MYNVLIASKFPLILKGLSAIANESIEVEPHIQTASSLMQLESILDNNKTHLLLLDLHIMDIEHSMLSHLGTLETLVKRNEAVKVIILYSKIETGFFKWMYQIGIKGILEKSAPLNDLHACIQQVSKNEIYIENKILLDFINAPDLISKDQNKELAKEVKLTKREKVIAQLLIDGKNNTQICAILQLQPSTVSTFKNHVFRKLQVRNLLELGRFKVANM